MTKNEARVRAFEAILAAYVQRNDPNLRTAEMIQRATSYADIFVMGWRSEA
jgi:hypothetical protein